jgi:hypothetical protein
MSGRARGAVMAAAVLLICLAGALALSPGRGLGRQIAPGAGDGGWPAMDGSSSRADASSPRIGPGVAVARRPVTPTAVLASYYSAAQARAFAAAGRAADGHPEALGTLDAEAQTALSAMRAELARQQPTAIGPAARAGASAVSSGAGAGSAGARLDLGQVDRGISGSSGSEVITGAQVWALAHLDPALGKLEVENRSGGDYTISLFGDDFGTVRLNGGLVVPGRAYALGTAAEITGAAAVAVHIRPAGVAATVYPGPLLPQGNG